MWIFGVLFGIMLLALIALAIYEQHADEIDEWIELNRLVRNSRKKKNDLYVHENYRDPYKYASVGKQK